MSSAQSPRLDALVAEFAAAWMRGERPDADAFFLRHAAEHGSELRPRLLQVVEVFQAAKKGGGAAPARLESGATDSGFRIGRELGSGGMGTVYEAEEIASGRVVALKVLNSELRYAQDALERFRREARIAALLSHRNCVFVFGIHEVAGSPAIAMELVGGETLEDRLRHARRGEAPPIAVGDAVRWGLEILDGVEAAHRAGVIHRDLKPSNVFLAPDGHVKVGDFGLSRLVVRDLQLTQSGAFVGSPLYASPEQVKGREVDFRTDIYSLGATLYALLAGRPAFEGGTVGETLARIVSDAPPPLRPLRPDIPRGLEKVILRAMEKDPARRFKSFAHFRAALEAYAPGKLVIGAISKRFGAAVIDGIVLGFALVVLSVIAAPFGIPSFGVFRSAGAFELEHPAIHFGLTPTLYWLYYALMEGLAGATVGKWLVGLRVVSLRRSAPDLAAAAVRAALYTGLVNVVPGWIGVLFFPQFIPIAVGVAPIVLIGLCSTMRRSNGYRGIHELLSGTRVVAARSPLAPRRTGVALPRRTPVADASLPPRLGAYDVEGVLHRTAGGRCVVARDGELARGVWIHVWDDASAPAHVASVHGGSHAELRWLCGAAAPVRYDVFEALDGAVVPALSAAREAIEWPVARRWLMALADALDGGARGPQRLAQLGVDATGGLRIVDANLLSTTDAASPARSPLDLLSDAAGAILRIGGERGGALPVDLPDHAVSVVRRLTRIDAPYASVEEARGALAALEGRPTKITRVVRTGQLLIAHAFALFALGGIALQLAISNPRTEAAAQGVRALQQESWLRTNAPGADAIAASPEDVDARLMLVANLAVNGQLWASTSFLPKEREAVRGEIVAEAKRRFPNPTDEDVLAACATLAAHPRSGFRVGPRNAVETVVIVMVGATSAVGMCGFFGSAFAVFMRGGLTLSLAGIRVRRKNGAHASRLRCLVRSLVAWVPVVIALGVATAAGIESSGTGFAIAAGTAALYAAGVVHAALNPTRGLHDRIAGTRLVMK